MVTVRGLGTFDDVAMGEKLVGNFRRMFRGDERAAALLDSVATGKIARGEVSAFDARQILAIGSDELSAQLREVWGEVRQSDELVKARIADSMMPPGLLDDLKAEEVRDLISYLMHPRQVELSEKE